MPTKFPGLVQLRTRVYVTAVRACHSVIAARILHNSMVMPGQALPIKILLVRSWLHSLEHIRSALRAAGFAPRFHRVDIEPALHAALTRSGFDVVVLDPGISGMTRALVQSRIDELRPGTPLILLRDVGDLGREIAAVIEARQN